MMSRTSTPAWLFVVVTAFVCAACGGGDGNKPPPGGQFENLVLGSGTDIFGEYATESNVKERVLNLDALNNYGMLAINRNVEEATFIHTSGTDISEYAGSLALTVGVQGTYKFFSGSIDTRFDRQFYSSAESSFATIHELVKKSSLQVRSYQSAADLRSFMTPQATEALATWPAHQVIARYGTHVMVGIYEGARLDYSLGITITEQVERDKVGVYASAGYKQMFASAQVNVGMTAEEINRFRQFRQETRVQAKGGTVQFAYCSSDNPAVCESNRLTWLNSIDANPVFCAIMHNGLIPIWEFAPNAARSAEIEAYFRAYGIGKHVQYPFPRYEETGLTVIDHHTGLMWAKRQGITFFGPNWTVNWEWVDWVVEQVNHARHASYTDWRAPEFEELWTLVDHSRAPGALVDAKFGMIDAFYWSRDDAENDPQSKKGLLLLDSRRFARPHTLDKNEMASLIIVRDAY